MVGLGRFGHQPDRDVEVRERLVEVALRALDIGAADIGRAVIGSMPIALLKSCSAGPSRPT